jgi:hypothetical protein
MSLCSGSTAASRIAHKLRPAAAADKNDRGSLRWQPRAGSFMRWFGGAHVEDHLRIQPLEGA